MRRVITAPAIPSRQGSPSGEFPLHLFEATLLTNGKNHNGLPGRITLRSIVLPVAAESIATYEQKSRPVVPGGSILAARFRLPLP
jgi:hypothetical protein